MTCPSSLASQGALHCGWLLQSTSALKTGVGAITRASAIDAAANSLDEFLEKADTFF